MNHGPKTVHINDLDFHPTQSFVYYCAECDEFIDVDDVNQHIDPEDGYGTNNLCRVEVIHP